MSDVIDVSENIEEAWRGMLNRREPRNGISRPDHRGDLIHTSYKQVEQLTVDLTKDLMALNETIISDFNKKFELSPKAIVDLRTVVTSAISCGSQLGATCAFEVSGLAPHVPPTNGEDYVYDAIVNYNQQQNIIVNRIWEGVNS